MLALGMMSSATQQKARTPRNLLFTLVILLIWVAAAVGSCSNSDDDQESSAKKRAEDAEPPSQAILEQERAQLRIRVLQNGDTEESKLRKIINRAEGPLLVAPLAVQVEWRVSIESLQGHRLRSRLERKSTYNPWNKLQANTYEARVGGVDLSPASIPHKGTFTFEVVNIDRCISSGFIEADCRNERSFPPALIRTLNLPYWFLPQGNVDCIIADVLRQLEVNDGSNERERATQDLVDALLRVGDSHQNC